MVETYKRTDLQKYEAKIITKFKLTKSVIKNRSLLGTIETIFNIFMTRQLPEQEETLKRHYRGFILYAMILRLRSEAMLLPFDIPSELEIHTLTTANLPGMYARLHNHSVRICVHQHGFICNNYDEFFVKDVYFNTIIVWNDYFKELLIERYGVHNYERIQVGSNNAHVYDREIKIDYEKCSKILYLVSIDLMLKNKKALYEKRLINYLTTQLLKEHSKHLMIRLLPSNNRVSSDVANVIAKKSNVALSTAKCLHQDLDWADLVISVDSSVCSDSLNFLKPTVCILEDKNHSVAFPSVVFDENKDLKQLLLQS